MAANENAWLSRLVPGSCVRVKEIFAGHRIGTVKRIGKRRIILEDGSSFRREDGFDRLKLSAEKLVSFSNHR